ncbi:VOC family protein [Ruminiclostridium cellobioparum]|uniref:Glyoxalase/fosfomycin resistance/dioxygenase domain-containing protein n=1 Tax=Ruminiclostridium cellobioparum subsp. termitidis CT1112 TaxID=1195236 RepID=S0FXY9_RUMCE|nr:VOC family protein [Ruminiclostridium cellobioparum]EMS73443.1 hypothetical protein CTER_0546 [Ruminiclostridium cellobioparum subsp. termitidis CT1112]
MKSIIPNISVENCRDALEFYKSVFGGEIKMVKTADNSDMFKGHEGKIMHSELHIAPNCIMYFTDLFGERAQHTNVQLVLELDSREQIEKVYAELSKEDAIIIFELQKTFWGAHHAVLKDKYAVTWGLNYTEMG